MIPNIIRRKVVTPEEHTGTGIDGYGHHRLKAFSLRMEKELRKKLEVQAKKNIRNLTEEINFRLEQSLEEDKKENNTIVELQKSIDLLDKKLEKLIKAKS